MGSLGPKALRAADRSIGRKTEPPDLKLEIAPVVFIYYPAGYRKSQLGHPNRGVYFWRSYL